MTHTTSRKLKTPKGWFAAGQPMEKALTLLPDGPFKLFVYLCLHARRDTGSVEVSQSGLARCLGKSRRSVGCYLQQLQRTGICRAEMTHNSHAPGVIEITEEYWPYQRGPEAPTAEEALAYVAEVKKQFRARACVRSSFSLADERLAHDWFEQGVALEQIEHTLLLGCSRKYVAWRNGHNSSLIASLRYFEPILEEVAATQVDPPYWDYVRQRLERLEKMWLERQQPRPSTPEGLGHRATTVPKLEARERPFSSQTPRTPVQESCSEGS